ALVTEQPRRELRRLRLVELVEPGTLEGLRIGLDDPGRALRLVLVAVTDEDAVLGLAEEEGEGVERAGRAHPGEEIRPQIDGRLELVGEGVAQPRIGPVPHPPQIRLPDPPTA